LLLIQAILFCFGVAPMCRVGYLSPQEPCFGGVSAMGQITQPRIWATIYATKLWERATSALLNNKKCRS